MQVMLKKASNFRDFQNDEFDFFFSIKNCSNIFKKCTHLPF